MSGKLSIENIFKFLSLGHASKSASFPVLRIKVEREETDVSYF